MKFLDVKTDYAFKRVFGSEQSKPILISFLNALLEYSGEYAITDLTIVDPYQIPLLKGMKDSYVDVKAVLANGKRVIIEMQVLNVDGIEQRILYNAAKQYSTQLQKGEEYKLLNPVIALTFTDFIMFEETKEYTSRFKLMETQRLVSYSDDVELIFIELPKFIKELNQLKTIQDKWIYFVRNAGSLEFVPDTLKIAPIEEAFAMINEAGMSEEELEVQHRRKDFIWQQRGALRKALSEGEAIGMAKGRAEGEATGKSKATIEIARKLLMVMDDMAIAKITGLPVESIAKLR